MKVSKDFNDEMMKLAKKVSESSDCIRRQYGAVVVSDNGLVIGIGSNTSPRRGIGCNLRGRCIREELGIQSGTRYELCNSIHAEARALSEAAQTLERNHDEYYSTHEHLLYLYGSQNGVEIKALPCIMCQRLILDSRIEKIIISDGSGGTEIIEASSLSGILPLN